MRLQGEAEGVLCLKQAWPAMFRTLFGAQDRFEEAYFSSFKACCIIGAIARMSCPPLHPAMLATDPGSELSCL